MKKEQIVLLLLTLLMVAAYAIVFLARKNYEFVIYVGVILVCLSLLIFTRKKIDYSLSTLMGLSVWAFLHLSGGGIIVGGGRLYEVMIFRLPTELPVFRYDQMVHMWGFGVCVLLSYDIIKAKLHNGLSITFSTGLVLVMAALGFGALNEILEFMVSLIVKESGVGDYINTSLDLSADLLGAVLAAIYLKSKANAL